MCLQVLSYLTCYVSFGLLFCLIVCYLTGCLNICLLCLLTLVCGFASCLLLMWVDFWFWILIALRSYLGVLCFIDWCVVCCALFGVLFP